MSKDLLIIYYFNVFIELLLIEIVTFCVIHKNVIDICVY